METLQGRFLTCCVGSELHLAETKVGHCGNTAMSQGHLPTTVPDKREEEQQRSRYESSFHTRP